MILLALVALVGLIGLAIVLRMQAQRSAPLSWPTVDATIIESRVVGHNGPDDTGPYTLDIRYRYVIAGASHEGRRHRLGDASSDDAASLWRIAHRYRPGDRVICHVDPADPGRVVLDPDSGDLGGAVGITAALVALGLGGLVLLRLRGGRRSAGAGQHVESVVGARSESHPISSRLGLLLFSAVFLAFGAIFPWIFLVRPALLARDAQQWRPTDCVVIASSVRTNRSGGGTTYSADVLYEYHVGGVTHRASRVGTSTGSTSERLRWMEVVRTHPPGHRTTCFVDPSDPYRSVLDPAPPRLRSLAAITLLFPLVGLIGVVGTLVSMRRARRAVRAKSVPEARDHATAAPWRSPLAAPGAVTAAAPEIDGPPRVLEVRTSRLVKALILTGFATIWNGFVWALLVPMVWHAWSGGIGFHTLFITLFGVVFVGAGLAVLGAALHALLSLANPRIRLRPSVRHFRLGDAIPVDWELVGGRRTIRHLTIDLVGRERASYRQGTSTITEHHEFLVERCLEMTDPHAESPGAFTMRLPIEAVPSFKATNNAIEWVIRVNGTIPHWPDIADEFPIEVLGPLPAASDARWPRDDSPTSPAP